VPTVRLLDSYLGIDGAAWDALVGDGSPFLEHTFLAGLEALGCAVPETGWTPRPVLVHDDDGRLIGAAPAWVKTHSMGEFVYDHAWAQAAHANGYRYYPKLVVGVPFSPVTGQRLLMAPGCDAGAVRSALWAGLRAAAEDCEGVHVLFDTEDEATWLAERGVFQRLQFQYHWHNRGYGCFEDFVSTFPSKKRNKIRRERKELRGLRITAGTRPTSAQLDAMHGFYVGHTEQFGPWGRAYLTRDFFQHLGAVWGERLHLVLAHDGERPVAGTFNVIKGDRLYGRHWGAEENVKFLHFEVCYYQAIDECIRRGVQVFEPGHGGEHKGRRGFDPTLTRSSHWLAEPRLHAAFRDHATREAAAIVSYLADGGADDEG
jgi:predicted N-acyltransferase